MALLLQSLVFYGQETYTVRVNTVLNVRGAADAESQLLGTLENGETVSVYETKGDWAQIAYKGGYGYVNKKFIKPSSLTPAISSTLNTDNPFKINTDFLNVFQMGKEWIYVIFVLSIVLFIIRLVRGSGPLEGGLHIFNWVLFLIVCLIEIFYVLSLQSDSIWFCMPDNVGWGFTIVNFLLFGFIVYNQLLCLFCILRDVQYNSYASFTWNWGIYSWPTAVVVGIICGFVFPDGIAIVGGLFILAQLIQIIIIFKNVLPQGGFGHAILCTTVYLFGATATAVVLVHFLVLLVIVLIALLILRIMAAMNESESNKRCSNCSHLSGSYCHRNGRTIYNPGSTSCNGHS